jgi:hypothetical protein
MKANHSTNRPKCPSKPTKRSIRLSKAMTFLVVITFLAITLPIAYKYSMQLTDMLNFVFNGIK